MMRARILVGVAVAAVAGAVPAEEIALAAREIDNLGIRFEPLAPAAGAAGIEATAQVVLPPAADAVVSARQPGLVTRLSANVGDQVAEGQLLAQLSSPGFVSLQREFLHALNAQRLAESEYARDAQMHTEGIIAARRLQQTATARANAQSALNEHRQLLVLAGMGETDIRELASRQRFVASLPVNAPFSGVIAERMASVGERLDAMSPVYRLIDTSELWLDIKVPQQHLALVHPGARVTAAGNQGMHAGNVMAVGRAIDPSNQSAAVRARLDEETTGLMPGQFVAVRVHVYEAERGASTTHDVPASAVIRSGKASYVFVRTASGVEVIEVNVVSVNGDRAIVGGPLETGATVAASGISALKSLWLSRAEEQS